ncbi:MAG: hypothetical protein MI921_24310 [Cytophagales bacterium]|nr:hypothetical protein [Cytophagales bacterium]
MRENKSITQLSMHQDHTVWESEIRMWQEDLKFWKKELNQLKEDLIVIASAAEKHLEATDHHEKSIAEHHSFLQKHETDLSILLENTGLDRELAARHLNEQQKHNLQKDAHERIKKYHHTIVALCKALRKAIEHAL